MLPKQKEIEIPLLEVLKEIGGQGRPRDIYPLVTSKFPNLDENDLGGAVPSGTNRWTNRIQWVRQKLVNEGQMDSPAHGIWRITEEGRRRLASSETTPQPAISAPTFLELYEDYEAGFRAQILEALHDLAAREFEQFARRLLTAYGFGGVEVTSVSNDGGIDGYGNLRLGLASMRVAFQCKRWQGNVGRTEVDRFRGAIQGEFEQGIFFTTSDFTKAAKSASLKGGAVPIILLDGESIVDLMLAKGLGVRRVPLYAYELVPDDFESGEE